MINSPDTGLQVAANGRGNPRVGPSSASPGGSSQSGFSLVEILVAEMIVIVALLLVLDTAAISAVQSSQVRAVDQALAQATADQARLCRDLAVGYPLVAVSGSGKFQSGVSWRSELQSQPLELPGALKRRTFWKYRLYCRGAEINFVVFEERVDPP